MRWLRDTDHTTRDEAVEVHRAIRIRLRGVRGEVHLHRSTAPLDQADRSAPEESQLDLWPNECEGLCGVLSQAVQTWKRLYG